MNVVEELVAMSHIFSLAISSIGLDKSRAVTSKPCLKK
jgi:hypothetical protein